MLLVAAAHETGLLAHFETALAPCLTQTAQFRLSPSRRSQRSLLLTLLFLNAVGLRRTRDLRGYTDKACDVVELAQTYTRRWPVQENIIRDLITLFQRVNEQQVRLPDGRLLVFSVKEICRPILHGQKRRID